MLHGDPQALKNLATSARGESCAAPNIPYIRQLSAKTTNVILRMPQSELMSMLYNIKQEGTLPILFDTRRSS